jgi:hypothetical protein
MCETAILEFSDKDVRHDRTIEPRPNGNASLGGFCVGISVSAVTREFAAEPDERHHPSRRGLLSGPPHRTCSGCSSPTRGRDCANGSYLARRRGPCHRRHRKLLKETAARIMNPGSIESTQLLGRHHGKQPPEQQSRSRRRTDSSSATCRVVTPKKPRSAKKVSAASRRRPFA